MKPTPNQMDALREMINIGVGCGAGVLNTLLQAHINLTAPDIRCVTPSELPLLGDFEAQKLCLVTMPFDGPLEGTATMVFPCSDACRLVGFLTGKEEEAAAIDTLEAGTISEVGNIVLNGVMGTISNILGLSLTYQVPTFRQGDSSLVHSVCRAPSFMALVAHTRFGVDGLEARGSLVLQVSEGCFERMLTLVDELLVKEA